MFTRCLSAIKNPMKKYLSILSVLAAGVFLLPLAHAEQAPEETIYKHCLSYYQGTYSGLKDHKAYAYARHDAKGVESCAWSYGKASAEDAKSEALKTCAKKGIDAECQVVDSDGNWSLKKGTLAPLKKPAAPLDQSQIDAQMKIAKEAIKGNCLPFFKQHLEAKGHKAFGYALSENGNYACGRTYSNQTPEVAATGAIKGCEDNKAKRGKKVPKSKCLVFAKGNEIVMTVNDFGKEKSVDDFKYAIFKGNVSRIKWYLEAGFDLNTRSKDGITPLFIAAAKGNEVFFDELISKGAKIDILANDNSNLLLAAVMGENVNLVRYLIDKGQSINKPAREGNTPLHIAFARLNTYIITLLLQEGADPTIANDKGDTGLTLAKRWKLDIDSLKVVDIQQRDSDGWTALMLAAVKNDRVGLKKLIAKGADVNTTDKHGSTPLMHASDLQVLDTLLINKADINAKDDFGETALMSAAGFDNSEKVKFLLEKGADKSLKNKKGKTAADLAKDKAIKALIESY